ncbi:hypothetical protein AcW1_009808 [Taiwanofungus camphoratus]|nr:hypothetical protein AcV7_002400 [Antrodia cinnamomea]KAI0948241.1 hypothetical protein AcW1_009808 [Antrodia cinnamomea]
MEGRFQDKHDDIPPRCPSRIGIKRPQLKRVNASYNLFGSSSDTSDDDLSDDECDRSFCEAFLKSSGRRQSFESDCSDDSGSDEDDELAQIIFFEPVDTGTCQRRTKDIVTPSFPPLPPLPPPAANTIDLEFPLPVINDHGLSHNALANVKRFWDTRRAQWSKWNLQNEAVQAAAAAYDGIDPSDSFDTPEQDHRNSPECSHPGSDTSCSTKAELSPRVACADPNAPIYPRLGDLSKLHDAHSAIIDRVFCNFPMYTIHKVLYLHDMLHRALNIHGRDAKPKHGAFVSARSCSPESSDDERTLVSEDDSHIYDGHEAKLKVAHADYSAREWEWNWYARWQILMEKSQYQQGAVFAPTNAEHTCYPQDPAVVEESTVAADIEETHMENPMPMQKSTHSKSTKFFIAANYEDDEFNLADDYIHRRAAPCSTSAQFLSRRNLNHPDVRIMV